MTISITIREANLKNSGIDLSRHMSFFPIDSHGGRNKDYLGKTITLIFSGINEDIQTDIDETKKVFRSARGHLRRFYEHFNYSVGDVVYITKITDRVYKISNTKPDK